MSEELRPPCPYCGKDNTTLQTTVSVRHRLCKSCGARGPIFYKEEKADYPSWNTRPIEDALRAENERLKSKLDKALDKIFQIQEDWESEGCVCAACGICAGIPIEYQPLDSENCRTILEDWACGRPLPWEV